MPQNFTIVCYGADGCAIQLPESVDKSYNALKSIYEAAKVNHLSSFIECFDAFINNETLTGFFSDDGGRPASSWYERVPYSLCTCTTDWSRVHRQLDVKACTCKNGKRFIAYDLVKRVIKESRVSPYAARTLTKHIRQSGPINIHYTPWQPVVDLDDNEIFNCDN